MSTSSAIQASYRKQSLGERISISRLLPSPWIVLTLLLVCVVLLRLPASFFPKELDPDESQGLSNAMKFAVDPRPFIAVDGGSWGPLNSYLLSIFIVMGFKASFVLAHMLATVLACLQVLIGYLTLRRIGSEMTAALGGLLLVCFYGLATHPNFLNYAGELFPSVLLMAGFYAFVAWLDDNPIRKRGTQLLLLFLSGLALGAAPWCKLQAAPITLGLGLLIAAATFRAKERPFSFSRSVAELLVFGWGGVLTTCIMLTIIFATGAGRDFWYSYIRGNASYAGSLNVSHAFVHVLVMLLMTPLQQFLLVGFSMLLYAGVAGLHLVVPKKQAWALGGILVYAVSALVSVGRVQFPFFHHALFLVPPLSYLAVSITFCHTDGLQDGTRKPDKLAKAILAATLCATAVLYLSYIVRYVRLVQTIHRFTYSPSTLAIRTPKPPPGPGHIDVNFYIRRDSSDRIVAVVREIQKTYPVRSLEIWGWAPAVYVLTGIPPTTREAVVSPISGPMDSYFRPRFLNDLRRHPPDLFIDAVVPDLLEQRWSQNDGYETNPDVKAFIDQNYQLVDKLTLIEGAKPVRFFVRRTPE